MQARLRWIQNEWVLFQIKAEDLGGAKLDFGTSAISYYTGAFTSEYSIKVNFFILLALHECIKYNSNEFHLIISFYAISGGLLLKQKT